MKVSEAGQSAEARALTADLERFSQGSEILNPPADAAAAVKMKVKGYTLEGALELE